LIVNLILLMRVTDPCSFFHFNHILVSFAGIQGFFAEMCRALLATCRALFIQYTLLIRFTFACSFFHIDQMLAVCMHIFGYVHACIYAYVWLYLYMQMYACIRICVYTCTCAYMHMYGYVCICTCMHIFVYLYAHEFFGGQINVLNNKIGGYVHVRGYSCKKCMHING